MTRLQDQARAVREPFVLPEDWNPIPGHCSRCRRPALLVEDRWWHASGGACDPSKHAPAEFCLGQPSPE